MKKIYLIDDDKFFLKFLSTKLWKLGYTVKTFLTVEEALPNLAETPDLIVLDHNLGECKNKGKDYIPLLKNQARKSALIYVTSETCPKVINSSFKKGADMYLHKDVNLYERIQPAIEQLLKQNERKQASFWGRLFS